MARLYERFISYLQESFMPGVNCIVCPGGVSDGIKQPIYKLQQQRMGLFPHYTFGQPDIGNEALLIEEQHVNYPIQSFCSGNWQIFFENKVEPELKQRIEVTLHHLEVQGFIESNLSDCWNSLFKDIDDSFFLVAINPVRKLLLFANDALARLPVYIYKTEEMFIIARDLGYIKAICTNLKPDSLYLCLFAAFAYVPGHGTFYKEVDTLPGATLGIYNWAAKSLQLASQPQRRFPEPQAGGNRKQRLEQLAGAFEQALKRYSHGHDMLLSLSGGYDSRAIAAALSHGHIPFKSVTYRDRDNTAAADVAITIELASALKCHQQILDLQADEAEGIARLFVLKHGLNYFGTAFLMDYLEQVSTLNPKPFVFLTGDGGDKVMPCLLPDSNLNSANDLLAYLLSHNSIFPLETTCKWFSVPLAAAHDYLHELLFSYGSTDFREQYKRFLLAERAGRWLFEGEDRNRAYVRTETPFYDLSFYRLAMQVPDNWKQGKQFYAQFIRFLHPHLAKINIAESRETPYLLSHKSFAWALHTYRRVRYGYLQTASQSPKTSYHNGDVISKCIMKYQNHPGISNLLKEDSSIFTPHYLGNLSRSQIYTIYTLLAVITNEL